MVQRANFGYQDLAIIANYIWMRKDRQTPHVIPSHFFCNMQRNAARYAHAVFNLWVEDPEACEAYAIPENTTIHDLRSLLEFSKIPILASDQAEHIWAKVDIARLLVLKQTLLSPDCTVSLYTDFDIEDIAIYNAGFQKRLAHYGVVIGGSFNPNDPATVHRRAENGYMAFIPETAPILDFVYEFIAAHSQTLRFEDRNTVYYATMRALTKWSRKADCEKRKPFPISWQDDVASFLVQPASLFTGPPDTKAVAQPALGYPSAPAVSRCRSPLTGP